MFHRAGIIPVHQLSESQLERVRALEQCCNTHDGITLKLNWEMVERRSGEEINDWLYTVDGQIVGFLGMYVLKPSEAELSGMVHPDFRRKGIFRKLLQAATDECKRRGIPNRILIVQRGSESGHALAEHLGAAYQFSEYWMELSDEHSHEEGIAGPSASQISLRPAVESDLNLLVRLDVSGFGVSENDAKTFNRRIAASEGELRLIAELEGVPIGKLNILLHGGGFIFGFCVLPEYRGKGHGRAILAEAIRLVRSRRLSGKLALEVAATNSHALGLYKSVGFVECNINDYYACQ
ncbi:GNAT family N-acetyltransferase [Paenibacillus allorhizosphaerae]|uniref:Mycothiol acetyltransferase n=1 Tax=Paenibacillus allorhizosphaerae TaxID=2849866 RepID=A0ABM8VPM0_9BACL|nr:GNAT family N-acetyltransferase [Paenibacillus allorhizosphaerae]CAG7653116.1 Mycothiol acetyltransferase [Paenibacillus allorhizosphaerae]